MCGDKKMVQDVQDVHREKEATAPGQTIQLATNKQTQSGTAQGGQQQLGQVIMMVPEAAADKRIDADQVANKVHGIAIGEKKNTFLNYFSLPSVWQKWR